MTDRGESWRDSMARFAGVDVLRGAELIRELSGGPSSTSFLLEAGGHRLVARIDKPAARELKLDRQSEWDVLQAVAAAGIGPEPVWADPSRGLLLYRYIDGSACQRADIRDPVLLEGLAHTLKALHGLPPCGQDFKPEAAAQNYAEGSGTAAAEGMAQEVGRLLAQLGEQLTPRVLCHNDLVHTNIINAQPLRLIDWEYAAVGDPLFDLAVVVQHHQLSPVQRDGFLQAYFGCLSSEMLEKLELWGRLYDHLSCLWYQSMIDKFGPMPALENELQRTLIRLHGKS